MKKFVFGFLLLFLDFNLNFGRMSLNVLPEFVGYYLLLQGANEMKRVSPRFEVSQPFMVGMIIYTAILWVGSLLGVSLGMVGMVLGLIATAVHFYIAWLLVKALRELEENREADLYGAVLHKRWKILLGLTAAVHLLRLLGMVAPMDAVGMAAAVLVLADIIWAFLFVLGWNRAAGLWEDLCAAPAAGAESSAAPAEEPAAAEAETPAREEE